MGSQAETKEERIEGNIFKLDFKTFGRVTVSLPAFSLLFCLLSALIFQYDQVNDTQCNVYNFFPSISAVTGIAPQRYVWRICIALHSTPRFAIGAMYYNYFTSRLHLIEPSQQSLFKRLASFAFWTYTVENICLVLVAYISNVENYSLHEKIFVIFMITSCFHQFFHIILFTWCHPEIEKLKKSLNYKRICFVIIMMFTAGLLYCFARHRWYCEPGVFSIFSICEYGIAFTNIAFHYTASIEFAGFYWYAGLPSSKVKITNGIQPANNNHSKHE
ncbi:hypothetical protein CAPTEDRAFT_117781 [Capitella teleta]|uniref:CWH43-like N-terminal domain-containing protein n=1 Tax=Capitella teleta TaxID=283909 RepID=R7UND6_CAPTE|nr:hypothetical protein CAPTEDRAFT_117781 [Capitella teleta]|eukprot:ELU07578.1 hypothetical protein CAPTEDRAFT_117781 [Capitella teleta]